MKGNRFHTSLARLPVLMLAAETSPTRRRFRTRSDVTGARRSHWRLARSMDLDIYNLHPAHAKRMRKLSLKINRPFLFSATNSSHAWRAGLFPRHRGCVRKRSTIGIEVIPAHVTEYLNKVLTEPIMPTLIRKSWILPAVAPLPDAAASNRRRKTG